MAHTSWGCSRVCGACLPLCCCRLPDGSQLGLQLGSAAVLGLQLGQCCDARLQCLVHLCLAQCCQPAVIALHADSPRTCCMSRGHGMCTGRAR